VTSSRFLPFAALAALLLGAVAGTRAPQEPGAPDLDREPGRTLQESWVHLGDDRVTDWPEVAPDPEGERELVVSVVLPRDLDGERTLVVGSGHVDDVWRVTWDDTFLGELPRDQALRRTAFPVPAELLSAGEHRLVVSTERVGDDVSIGAIRLLDRPYRELFGVRPLTVRVQDPDGRPLAARLTLRDADGDPSTIHYRALRPGLVARDGAVIVPPSGEVEIELGPGECVLWASRGTEWSVARAEVELGEGAPPTLEMVLRREVDTRGWVAADTHLHTYTFSGHGDATLEERLFALEADGVEVAIATDHNHQVDYRPRQRELDLDGRWFAIVGNEVSTPVGHFNAFPLPAGGPRPDASLEDWAALDASIRGAGARYVILNHPRWPDDESAPFRSGRFDPETGTFLDGQPLPVDALELLNSSEPPDRWRRVLLDWFALLDAGHALRVVGSSDTHTVVNPAGVGRTYLRVGEDDPARLQEEAVVTAFRSGASSVSQGLFLAPRFPATDDGVLRVSPGETIHIGARVAGASWARLDKVTLVVSGRTVATRRPEPEAGRPFALDLDFSLTAPDRDAWAVVLAQGPALDQPWWWSGHDLVAVSQPLFLDVDGDGWNPNPR